MTAGRPHECAAHGPPPFQVDGSRGGRLATTNLDGGGCGGAAPAGGGRTGPAAGPAVPGAPAQRTSKRRATAKGAPVARHAAPRITGLDRGPWCAGPPVAPPPGAVASFCPATQRPPAARRHASGYRRAAADRRRCHSRATTVWRSKTGAGASGPHGPPCSPFPDSCPWFPNGRCGGTRGGCGAAARRPPPHAAARPTGAPTCVRACGQPVPPRPVDARRVSGRPPPRPCYTRSMRAAAAAAGGGTDGTGRRRCAGGSADCVRGAVDKDRASLGRRLAELVGRETPDHPSQARRGRAGPTQKRCRADATRRRPWLWRSPSGGSPPRNRRASGACHRRGVDGDVHASPPSPCSALPPPSHTRVPIILACTAPGRPPPGPFPLLHRRSPVRFRWTPPARRRRRARQNPPPTRRRRRCC